MCVLVTGGGAQARCGACVEVSGKPECHSLPSTLLETRSPVITTGFARPACPQAPSLYFPVLQTGTTNICYHIWLYLASGDKNSSPQANAASTFPTESQSVPGIGIYARIFSCVLDTPWFLWWIHISTHSFASKIPHILKRVFLFFFLFLVNVSLIRLLWLEMAKHIYNSSTRMAKAGRLQIAGKPRLHTDNLLEKKRKKLMF